MSEDGGPAFPVKIPGAGAEFTVPLTGEKGRYAEQSTGMSLRDYFACEAMKLAWAQSQDSARTANFMHDVADTAYAFADAMLKARKV